MKWLLGLLVAIAVSLVLFLRIESWLTLPTLRWALEHSVSSNLEIPWERFSLDIKAESLLRKTVTLRGNTFCFESFDKSLKLCAAKAHISLKMDFSHLMKSIREVSVFQIEGLTMTGKMTSQPDLPDKREANAIGSVLAALEGVTLPNGLEETIIKDLQIEVVSADFEFPENRYIGEGHFNCKTLTERSQLVCTVMFTESGTFGENRQNVKGSATLTFLEGKVFGPEKLAVEVFGDVRSRGKFKLNFAVVKRHALDWELKLHSQAKWEGLNYLLNGHGLISEKKTALEFDGGIANAASSKIAIDACHFVASSDGLKSLNLNCLGSIDAIKEIRAALPFKLALAVKRTRSERNPLDVRARVELLKMQDPLAPTTAWVESTFRGKWVDFATFEDKNIDCAFSWEAIPFQKIRKELKAFKIIIPAPFHVLRGKIGVDLACQRSKDKARFDFPIELRGRLSSPNQYLDWTTTGIVSWFPEARVPKPALGLELTSTVNKGKLQLPKLDIRSLPQLLSNSHFTAGKLKVEPSVVDYRLQIETKKEPLFISSNLAKTLIPLTGRVVIQSHQPLAADINVGNVSLELFRRKAYLEYLHFDLNRSSTVAKVGGSLKIPSPDYLVLVTLSGTTDSPQVILSSEPPLPEAEVVSVLLYGSPSRESSLSSADDVQNTQSVLLSRSINLLSLYVFASTPIQRIDFNPDKSEVAAAIKAGDRITISLGAAPTQSQTTGTLRVRRKISKSWSVVTELNSGGPKNASSGTAWLEWSKRY